MSGVSRAAPPVQGSRLMRMLVAAALLAGAPAPALAQEAQGFAELRLSLFPGAGGRTWQVVERVRPTLQTDLTERTVLVATIEAGLAQGRRTDVELERALRQSGLGAIVDEGICCAPEHRNRLLRVSGTGDYLDVDRLYLDLYARRLDLRIGRQAIHWGSAQFFNPTDPFPEVLIAEPWRPRRGANAVRATIPLGERDDFSAVVATSDALDEVRAAGRVRINRAGTDFALVGAWRGQDRALVGVDLRGTLGVGWWVEAAYFPGRDAHEEIAAGIDYSFPILERAVVFAQYYRNGAGVARPGVTGLLGELGPLGQAGEAGAGGPGEPRRDPFAPFVRGRNYALVGAALVALPELALNLAALANLNDGSGFVVPTVTWHLRGWLDLALSAQIPLSLRAGGGEFSPAREDLLIEEDLGPPFGVVTLDLIGLVPRAVVTTWVRASF